VALVPKPIHILLADDDWVVRAGLHALLDRQANLHVVGEAANGEDAVDLARNLKPDVVLMDLAMPGIGGLEAVRRISALHLDTKILVLSGYLQ
jgi:YesN/AraC family two-component response regulator